MANPFYTGHNTLNFFEMIQQLKQNPMQFILRSKFNVPCDLLNNPNAILQYLLSSGQVSQAQLNNAYQRAQSFRQ